MKTDWIIYYDATQGDLAYAMECLRCGTIQRVVLSIDFRLYEAMGKAFLRIHKECRERKSEVKP